MILRWNNDVTINNWLMVNRRLARNIGEITRKVFQIQVTPGINKDNKYKCNVQLLSSIARGNNPFRLKAIEGSRYTYLRLYVTKWISKVAEILEWIRLVRSTYWMGFMQCSYLASRQGTLKRLLLGWNYFHLDQTGLYWKVVWWFANSKTAVLCSCLMWS